MVDHIYLGPAPAYEACADAYEEPERARKECRVWKNQIERWMEGALGKKPVGLTLRVIRSQHDYCDYYEVAAKCEDEESLGYAIDIETRCPTQWDDTAKKELETNTE